MYTDKELATMHKAIMQHKQYPQTKQILARMILLRKILNDNGIPVK